MRIAAKKNSNIKIKHSRKNQTKVRTRFARPPHKTLEKLKYSKWWRFADILVFHSENIGALTKFGLFFPMVFVQVL